MTERQVASLLRRRHPLDERDLFACDGFPEVRRLGRIALRVTGDARMNTYFAIGDLCAQRSLGVDGRLLVFYVGKALNAYLRARSEASDSVNRRLAERARAKYLSWIIATARTNVTRHNIAVALWAVAELSDSDPKAAQRLERNLPTLFDLYRRAAAGTQGAVDALSDLSATESESTRLEASARPGSPTGEAETLDGEPLVEGQPEVSLERPRVGFEAHESGSATRWQGAQPAEKSGSQFEQMLNSIDQTTLADVSASAMESVVQDDPRERFLVSLMTHAPETGASIGADALAGEYAEGDHIDNRYEVATVLLGGMGVVYLCYDRVEREPLALKSFQNRFLQNERAVARFEQEALTWIRLEKHRHIVHARLVQRIGTRPYILLEHVSGPEGLGADLRSWIENRRLTLPLAVEFGLHVALGMQHAAERVPGLVHRDLKPANILVTHDGIAKVTDFGLVRSVDFEDITPMDVALGRGSGDNRLTRMGAVIGTAPYLSPEQCRSNKVDARADIYSFGCLLYEMLTGSFVFDARNLPAWIHAHLHETPKFAPAVAAGLPPRLTELVLRCLAKPPDERPQTWGDIVLALAGIFRDLTGSDPVMEISGQALEAHELMDKAYSLTELGRLDEALSTYDRALALDADNAWAWARKGRALRLLRRFEDALACYDRSLAIEPRYAWAWKGRGMVLERMGRLAEALDSHRMAAEIDPGDVWNWYNQAETLHSMDDTQGALAMLDAALRVDPRHASSWGKRGQILRASRQYAPALEAYRQAVAIDPAFAWAHNGCGLVQKALGDLPEAVLSFRRAVRHAPREVWYWYNLAEALVELGRYDEALQPVQEATRLDPDHAFSWAKLGQVLRYLRRYSEALEAYRRAVTLQPANAWAHNGCGIVLERMERYEEALASYRRAAELSPDDVWYWYNQGNMLAVLGRFDEAVTVLSRAVAISSGHANSWARLGSAYRLTGHPAEAVKALEEAVRLQPDFAWAWGELGQALEALGRSDEAAEAWQRAGQPAGQQQHTILQQADQLLDANQPDLAARLLQRALAEDAESAPLWGRYGQALRRLGRIAEAVDAFSRAVELDPRAGWSWNGLGMAQSALRRLDSALESFQRAAMINPNDVWAWYNQGDTLLQLGRRDEALAMLQRAINADPSHAESWAKLGQAQRLDGQFEASLAAYDRALSFQPAYGWAWNGRGLALEKLGRREEAIASYERAIAEDAHIIWYRNNLVDVLLETGRVDAALRASQAAVDAMPDEATAWARLGMAQRRAALNAEAVDSYRRAVTRDPAYGWAWNGLGLAHLALNAHEDAAAAFERATRCSPNDVWYWRNLGDALMMSEDFAAAAEAFERALSLEPDHVSTRLKLKMANEASDE
jgi:tetratricopeptide (TPR) repeat protein/tRNA A-37 threonylcarbamoyl transferase component Bud32